MIDGDISFFYSDPKLKDVTFEYLVNGEKLSPRQLTSTSINQVFGSSEFSVAGNYSKTEEINEVQVIIKTQDKIQSTISVKPCGPIPTETQRCIPKVPTDTKPISTDMFMKRLWAFKRINYLLTGAKECIKLVAAYNIGNNDSCIQEALGLALEYNFVTDLTSLVIEENDDYIKEGPVQVNKNPKFVSLAADQGFVPITKWVRYSGKVLDHSHFIQSMFHDFVIITSERLAFVALDKFFKQKLAFFGKN